jgi:hypothetical protein
MATELGTSTAGGFTEFLLDAGSKEAIVNACAGCCGSVYIRPRLCLTTNLSGDTGEADEGSAIGLQVSSLDAAGSFFCFNGLCYYVPSTPDYWDATAVAGTDFRVVTQGEFDGLTQYASCDLCPCAQPQVGPCFSGGSTLTLSYTADNVFTTAGLPAAPNDRRDLTEITTIAIRAPIAGCPYPNYVAEPLQHVNGVATDP